MVANVPEAARGAALRRYHVLDTSPAERFDLFTRLGTWVHGVPILAINLIDAEVTFFKSAIGFPAYTPRRATSICAHAIAAGEPVMEVADLTRDPRFHDHPMAVSLGVRVYAGALLRNDEGHTLETLCIGDRQPRRLQDDERDKLVEQARGVCAVLDLHRKSVWLEHVALMTR